MQSATSKNNINNNDMLMHLLLSVSRTMEIEWLWDDARYFFAISLQAIFDECSPKCNSIHIYIWARA